jgi:hypothetical protein
MLAFVGVVVVFEGLPVARYYYAARDGSPPGPFYGAYDVEAMATDGRNVDPSFAAPTGCWRHVALDRRRAVAVLDDGSLLRFGLSSGHDARPLLTRGADTLVAQKREDGGIEIVGTLDGRALHVRARATEPRNETLMVARFRWFNLDPD